MIKHSENLDQILSALSKAQGELEAVAKKSKGHGYFYTDLADLYDAIRPVLAKHGLSHMRFVTSTETDHMFGIMIGHESGQYIMFPPVAMPSFDGTKRMNSLQVFGSQLTYMARYLTGVVFGVATEKDTDGTQPEEKQQRPQAQKDRRITEKQVKYIYTLINNVYGQEGASKKIEEFKKYYGVESFADLPFDIGKKFIDGLKAKEENLQ